MMDQFLSKLLDKYGLVRIVIAVLIGFIFLWALAHFTAAPGGNVSVLWGLVQYTKGKPTAQLLRLVPFALSQSSNKHFPSIRKCQKRLATYQMTLV